MKKIIPFKKKLNFDTNVSEITSISLENTLGVKENIISGELIINGTYKITESSIKIDNFEFKIPVDIDIDDKYKIEDIIIDIDDFYYEIINNNILEVNIDIKIDNLTEKEQINNIIEESIKDKIENENKRCIEEEFKNNIEKETKNKKNEEEIKKENQIKKEENNQSLQEEYSTYHIYIVREGDSLETIMTKYKRKKEDLVEYNDPSEIKIGDKIIIPISNE